MKGQHDDVSLDYDLTFVGLPMETEPHNGLMGAKLEAEVFSRLKRGEGLLEEFKTYPVPERVAKARIRG